MEDWSKEDKIKDVWETDSWTHLLYGCPLANDSEEDKREKIWYEGKGLRCMSGYNTKKFALYYVFWLLKVEVSSSFSWLRLPEYCRVLYYIKKKKWRNMTNPKSSKFFNTVISQKCPMWWLWATTKYSEILPHVHSLELTVKFHTPSKADNRRLSLIWISETRKIGKIKRNRNYSERRKCWHTFYVCECFIYLYTYI